MSCSNLPPYMLLELPDITDCINYPLNSVQRIKYTCFDVSRSLIAFGATSGGIYVFNRSPCEFVQLIPNKDGAITRLSISSDEKHIAFANGRGVIIVTECNQSLSGGHSSVTSKEHQGNEVTAMVWNGNMLFSGDDVGRISVLQLHGFIAKTMFQSLSQTIMNLDSRVCQIDVQSCMLLVSTLTRCYICDTTQEQYRQIGQKLRDGEFGACFVNKDFTDITENDPRDFSEAKKYIANDGTAFAVSKELENTFIVCARPSSRLWEAIIDGTVKRTHQFKQVLGKTTVEVVCPKSYNDENLTINDSGCDVDGKSVNFYKIYPMKSAIFSFKKDALYFLNLDNVDYTVWCDKYKDVVDCKVFKDTVYIWLSNGSLVNLNFMRIEKFLVKCYVDEKYILCANTCAVFSEHLLSSELSPKLRILVGLRDKIDAETLKKIENVLAKFDNLKSNDATQMKSGIYVVDNTYNAQTSLDDNVEESRGNEIKFSAFKELSVSVSDKLNSSKKILKEKFEDFNDRMKHLGAEKIQVQELNPVKKISREDTLPIECAPLVWDGDIIFKESSQKAIDLDNNRIEKEKSVEKDKACRSLYQYFRLSLVGKEVDGSNLVAMIENYACDIKEIYNLMLLLEKYCMSIDAKVESRFVPNKIFLTYLTFSPKKDEILECIILDETLYKYFVDSCITVNSATQKLSNLGCQCGFPLPYARTNQTPEYSGLIDEFIERQWSSQSRDQCYDVCKKMPYSWRKILYLRRNEDLMNILRVLLQMLDQSLLHTFLPQFTLDTWDRAVELYATLHANMCLNCAKKFDHMSVRDTLSWDELGAMMVKSIGGRNAMRLMEKHARLIDGGALTVKFYHTCLMVTMFEKYDVTATGQLTDALYSSYNFKDARDEICNLLRNSTSGHIKNTSLPMIVAAKSEHWGLKPLRSEEDGQKSILTDILDDISIVNDGVIDCALCGLPLKNDILIQDGGLCVFKCGHIFHGACLDLNKVKLCPSCTDVKNKVINIRVPD